MIESEGSTCGGILVKIFFPYYGGLYVLNLFFDGVTGIFTWQQLTVRAKKCRCFCPFECAVRSQLANGRTQGTERRTPVSPKQGLRKTHRARWQSRSSGGGANRVRREADGRGAGHQG